MVISFSSSKILEYYLRKRILLVLVYYLSSASSISIYILYVLLCWLCKSILSIIKLCSPWRCIIPSMTPLCLPCKRRCIISVINIVFTLEIYNIYHDIVLCLFWIEIILFCCVPPNCVYHIMKMNNIYRNIVLTLLIRVWNIS